MSLYATTRVTLRHQIADLLDDLVLGTVSSPASGTFVCALTDWEKPDGYFTKYIEVYDYSGTGAGTSGNPTDWTNTDHTLTFKPAATLTAADSVEMHQKFTVAQYNRAINEVVEMVAKEALVNEVDETLVLDNLLSNSMFEADSTLTGWTDSSNAPTTSERSTTFVMEGSYSAKTVSDGTNANWIYQSVTDYAKHLGKPYVAKCLVHCTTADRVRAAIYDGSDRTYSDYHDGKDVMEFSVTGTFDDEATEFTKELRTETGAAVTAYWDASWLATDHIYEYSLPTSFVYVHKIEMEGNVRDRYDYEINQDHWKIIPAATQVLKFDSRYFTPIPGRKIRISGMASPATMSADSTQCPINPVFIKYQAAALLHQSRIRGRESDAEYHEIQFKMCQMLADKERMKLSARLPNNSRRVIE